MSCGPDHDPPKVKKAFMCGVCEGFYGKPWNQLQRQELFVRMQRMSLNTYLYAPKDDYKHRLFWRDLYTEEEADELKELICFAKKRNITFVYALSPGLDVTYSGEEDCLALNSKLDQVKSFGCDSFALLFDDIEKDLGEEDEVVFPSVAHAQAAITNAAFAHLARPHVFLFCPTEYCTTRAVPDVIKSEYLQTLGEQLDKAIDVLWTGPKVVSRRITPESLSDVSRLLQRAPVVWDNLHANDYDQTRLFLGPYSGRPAGLKQHVNGVLTNPNCEFEANFIVMHTLAQWCQDRVESYPVLRDGDISQQDVEMSIGGATRAYQPKTALTFAIKDWYAEFYKPRSSSERVYCPGGGGPRRAGSSRHEEGEGGDDRMDESPARDSARDAVMRDLENGPRRRSERLARASGSPAGGGDSGAGAEGDSRGQEDTGEGEAGGKADRQGKGMVEESLDSNDLGLLCELFWLPFEHGPQAVHLLKQAHWLVGHTDRIRGAERTSSADQTPEVREWYDKAIHFHGCHKDVVQLVDKFVHIPNRILLYQLYPYISDMRSVLGLLNSYIKWHGMGKPDKEPFHAGEQEPWVFRGGLHSEFRRLLPMEGGGDLFPPLPKLSSGNKVYTVRPYYPSDKADVYSVWLRTCDDGLDGSDIFSGYPDLGGDGFLGALLALYPQWGYVLEDDRGVCGYALAAPDVKEYLTQMVAKWLPQMTKKYPKYDKPAPTEIPAQKIINTFHETPGSPPEALYSKFPAYLQMSVIPTRAKGLHTPSRLLDPILKGLRAAGVRGIHTLSHSSQMNVISAYLGMGFDEVTQGMVGNMLLVLGKVF